MAKSARAEVGAEEILAGIRRWVEIESQTADVAGVNRVMDAAEHEWREAGAEVQRIAGRDGRGDHLLVTSPWGRGDGVLVLCHLDTVHPKGTLAADLPFRVEGDKAFGPGIYDMKGGAYIALAAYREIVRAGRTTPLPIRVLIVSDEEVGSPTSRALIEAEADRARYVLVTEPARDGGKVVTGRKGVARYEMHARGRPAHSGSKHAEGRSAILEIARQIVDIQAMTNYATGVTLNVGQIKGGTADNVVPEHCTAAIDMRVSRVEDAEMMDRRLKSLKPYDPDVRLTITGGLNRPPYEKSNAVASLFEHARRLANELGFTLDDLSTGGGSDGNFTAHKVATLDGLGVDGNGAHTLSEHLLISSLVPRMRLQQRLFETLS
ncbi:MAG TPA: M20 family metallopeptidase [Hyphomicrobiaceae bacterium]|nr:M20 family metallopeptidase [Hyphomicrobiaceae bacterium]